MAPIPWGHITHLRLHLLVTSNAMTFGSDCTIWVDTDSLCISIIESASLRFLFNTKGANPDGRGNLGLMLPGCEGPFEARPRPPQGSAIAILTYRKAAIVCTISACRRDPIRTKSSEFAPPSSRNLHLSKWVLACFSSSCRLVFDMTPITEFDPVLRRI